MASEVKVLADFNKVVLTCVLTPMQAARVIHQASSLALLTGVALANALHSLQVGLCLCISCCMSDTVLVEYV